MPSSNIGHAFLAAHATLIITYYKNHHWRINRTYFIVSLGRSKFYHREKGEMNRRPNRTRRHATPNKRVLHLRSLIH